MSPTSLLLCLSLAAQGAPSSAVLTVTTEQLQELAAERVADHLRDQLSARGKALSARDTAQLLTGRRNLPYGGVAYLQGLCNSQSYSVAAAILRADSTPK